MNIQVIKRSSYRNPKDKEGKPAGRVLTYSRFLTRYVFKHKLAYCQVKDNFHIVKK